MKYHKLILVYLLLLLAFGCSKSKSIPGDHGTESALKNKSFFEKVGQVKPYNVNSKFADAMKECIYADTSEKSCSLSKLPLLGISKKQITVDDILDRTMISHDFLGVAFKKALQQMYPEILQMFGSVNSIVISDKINPSFYYINSGAIYLSAYFFWKNLEEREITTTVKDYRSDFGTSLQFGYSNYYRKNNQSINYTADRTIRTDTEIFFPIIFLLFHELSHANDFFPRSFYNNSTSIDMTQTYEEISYDRYDNNKLISSNQPSDLTSVKLLHLAEVLFGGEPPTEEDNLLLAVDVANEFKKEKATVLYSFFSPFEDLASNAEESMMLYYYNIYKYVKIFKYPYSNFIVPNDYHYQVVWGQKGRVLEPEIKVRALYAIENILGPEVRQRMSEKFENLSVEEIPAN